MRRPLRRTGGQQGSCRSRQAAEVELAASAGDSDAGEAGVGASDRLGNGTALAVALVTVLAARLEEVVAANTRLHIMSEGRCTLSHSDHQAARGARSGLGLENTDWP
ncbi:hypothetical protein [Streptomyces sudanensis]|uniref:hypothetical protein n=1 Tax=Streptomyces sudanensis TaxID=436397 RepID=UPI0020CBB6F0|nr:hypothetical protein [Streptomyces sudanensis]MCQ0003240.1 hypothetical protein [Streptomyces sudanensis]